eukprot:gene746-biopygen633
MANAQSRTTRLRSWWADFGARRDKVPSDIRQRLPLPDIEKVTFFKRDELTTDLICCEIEAAGQAWFFHEEALGWDALLEYLEQLPGFNSDWRKSVIQPAFETCETIAYAKR